MRKSRRLLEGTAAERAIFDLVFDSTLWVMYLCATARKPIEAVQGFARIYLQEYFGIDRFAVFYVASESHGPMMVLGIGEEPHKVHIGLFSGLRDRETRNHPTVKIGYDLFIKVGNYVFCFDDTSKKRAFSRNDTSLLRRFANVAERMLAVLRKREFETDSLTGLPSRTVGDKAIVELAQANKKLVVGFVALDALQTINDDYGYSTGNRAFKHVAAATQKVVADVGGMVVRYSQEEFMFVFPDREDTDQVITDLVQFFRHKPFIEAMPKLRAKVSIGYTVLTAANEPRVIANAKRRADLSLRAARAAGGKQAIRVDG